MRTISYTPHSPSDIYGVAFANFENPSALQEASSIDLSQISDRYTWEESEDGNPKVSPSTSESGSSILVLTVDWYKTPPSSDDFQLPNLVWNSMITFSGDVDTGEYTIYSLIYWDSVVPLDPKFERLTLSYSSVSTVITGSDGTDFFEEYTEHVLNDAIINSEIENKNHDTYHSQLNDTIYKSSTFSFTKPSGYLRAGNQLNGMLTNDESPTFGSMISKLEGYNYKSIPECTNENAKLFISKHLGVGFYVPGDRIYLCNGSIKAPELPEGIGDNEYEFYMIDYNACLFYVPKQYKVYLSYISDIDTEVWSGSTVYSEIPLIVPSFFNIMPLVWYQIPRLSGDTSTDRWCMIHPYCIDSEGKFLNSPAVQFQNQGGNSAASILWDQITSRSDTMYHIEISDVISNSGASTSPLYPLFYDDTISYTTSERNNIVNYFSGQVFISYATFKQALRNFPSYNVQISDCGVVCRKKGKRDVFIPYSLTLEPSGFTSVSLRSLPESSIVDNLLYYEGTNIGSMVSDEVLSVDSSIQMKNGIIVKWNGTKWEGIV